MIIHDIEKLLPHRKPMIFISDIEKVDIEKGTLTAKIEIKKTDIMFQENINGIPGYAILEYMAQAIGCFVGHYDLHNNPDSKPGVGFVIGTRKLNITKDVLKLGETYFIDVSAVFCDDTIASFECNMYNKETSIADAIVNAYRPTDIETFMKERL